VSSFVAPIVFFGVYFVITVIFYSSYVRTMLQSMDSVKCWLKGIESDQGYQNYLFYNGFFNTIKGNATLFQQGYGVVNTIGAMNGFRLVFSLLFLVCFRLC
jgi:hypothetical protein